MKDFAGPDNDRKEDELQRVPEFMRASAFLDRRQQQILQSEQAMIGIQRSIRSVTIDIARLLAASPSAGNQAMLERSFGELNGLANASAQTAMTAPSGGDSGTSRGADVDLAGTKAAIESHGNSSGRSAMKDVDDKTRNNAAKTKEFSASAPAEFSGADRSAHEDAKPDGDRPTSNLDRINKLASEASRTADDPIASASSDASPLPDKPRSRSKVAALKLDHAKVAAKSDAPERQPAQGLEPSAQGASTLAKTQTINVAAVHKAPSPGGM